MKFNPDDYGSNTVMHCDTEEKAIIFCNFLHSQGKCWNSGERYDQRTNFMYYKHKTCYRFVAGTYYHIDHFREYNYQILEFDDFEWDDYTPPEKEKPVKLRFSW